MWSRAIGISAPKAVPVSRVAVSQRRQPAPDGSSVRSRYSTSKVVPGGTDSVGRHETRNGAALADGSRSTVTGGTLESLSTITTGLPPMT